MPFENNKRFGRTPDIVVLQRSVSNYENILQREKKKILKKYMRKENRNLNTLNTYAQKLRIESVPINIWMYSYEKPLKKDKQNFPGNLQFSRIVSIQIHVIFSCGRLF